MIPLLRLLYASILLFSWLVYFTSVRASFQSTGR